MLTSENPNSKLFWKTSKQLLKIGKISQNVPTLKLNDEFAETDLKKAEMLNKYFASQSYVNDDNKVLPQLQMSYTIRYICLLLLLQILKMFSIMLMLVSLVDQIL